MKEAFFLLVVCLLLVACKPTTTGNVIMNGEKINVESDGDESIVTFESDEGKQVMKSKTGKNSWCPEGGLWQSSGSQGGYKMVVQGIVASGKYQGYCHVRYDIDAPDTQGEMDYYFTEDGEGYQVMNINGQKFESSWTS